MGNLFRVSALLMISVSTLHCANQKSYELKTAPVSEQELGLIVQTNTAQLDQIVTTNPQATVRVLNAQHGLYEVNHISWDTAQAISSRPVYKNTFVKGLSSTQKSDLSLERLALNTTEEAITAMRTCMNSNNIPELQVSISYNPETLTINLGEEVSISALATAHAEVGGDVRFMWDMLSPGLSEQKITTGITNRQTIKPDSVGLYRFLVVAQGADLSCTHRIIPLLVTANPELSQNTVAKFSQNPTNTPPLSLFKHLDAIQAQEAWSLGKGEHIVVAVIDSGVNYNHPLLRNNMVVKSSEEINGQDSDNNGFIDDTIGWDFINNDRFPYDDDGHGSHVSGLIASPVFGVAPKAKILAVKALNAAGSSDIGTVVSAIYYAVDNGAKIINASLGFQSMETAPQPLLDAVAYAQSKDVIFLAAAGNGDETGRGYDITQRPVYPASITLDNVITVAATAQGTITSYSNYSTDFVHIAAPGGNGAEPVVSLTTQNASQSQLIGQSGTSMACPITVGVVALMLSQNHFLTPSEVRQILMDTGDDLTSLNGKIISGRQVNALKAVQTALDLQPALATM